MGSVEEGETGRTLFSFVRYWSRRWTGAGSAVDTDRGRDVMVVEAVQSLRTPGGATVNEVADELGIDQSGASRFITQAADRGYLKKVTAPGDARQRLVVVTDAGRELVEAAHRWQGQVFADLTADWSRTEVAVFDDLMHRLIEAQRRSAGRAGPPARRPRPGG